MFSNAVILTYVAALLPCGQWVEDNRFQVLSEVTSMNFRDLSSSGRLLVRLLCAAYRSMQTPKCLTRMV